MNKLRFDKIIKDFDNKVISINRTPGVFNYLNSINNMLKAKLYMDSIFDDINTIINKSSNKGSVLDFGAGCGFLSNLLSNNFKNVYGIDTKAIDNLIEKNSKEFPDNFFNKALNDQSKMWKLIMRNHSNIKISHYDGKNIPFNDDFFDVIVAYAVVEHIPLDLLPSILFKLNNIIKKGGKFFIFKLPQKWSFTEFFARLLGIGHHIKTFSRKEIVDLLLESGWVIEEFYYSDFVFEFPTSVTNKIYPLLNFLS